MKKFYMTMVAMLCGAAAMAQSIGTLSCADVEAVAGGETSYLEVTLNTENVAAISGIQFYFSLPENVSIAQSWDEDEEAYVKDLSFPIAKKDHNVGLKETETGYMAYLGGDNSLSYKTATNVVMKLGVSVAKEAADGTYDVNFVKAAISDKSDPVVSYDVPDFTAKLTVTGGTGINGVNADNENAPIYNLAGQRVNKAQKGIFIQNGKKSIK